MNQQLLSLMRARAERDWEFLATAAGEPPSVDLTTSALSAEALTSSGLMNTALVRRRVDALAAFDVLELLAVAQTWPHPGRARGNGSGASPALVEAWAAALRFLPEDMQKKVLTGDIPGAWEEEKVALTSPALRFDTWDEIICFAKEAQSYAELRAIDRATFPAASVSEALVEALLDIPPSRRWGRFQAVRVLRPMVRQLGRSACRFLLEVSFESWQEFSGDDAAQLLLHELAFAIDRQADVVAVAAEQLRSSLEVASGPLHLLRTAYVVAGTGWMMP